MEGESVNGTGVKWIPPLEEIKKVKALAIRPMKNKWSSCSTDGNLNFNKELLELDKEIGEYVIVHELLHFNIPNHGKLSKSLMSAYLGDYKNIEEKLNKITNGKRDCKITCRYYKTNRR